MGRQATARCFTPLDLSEAELSNWGRPPRYNSSTWRGRLSVALEFRLKIWYTYAMYNWSTDIRELKKNPEKYRIWRLEQLINFGLSGEKLKEPELKKYFNKLNIDPYRRKFLRLLLNGK